MKDKRVTSQQQINQAHAPHTKEPNRGPKQGPGKPAAPSKRSLSGPLGIFKRRMKPHGSDQ